METIIIILLVLSAFFFTLAAFISSKDVYRIVFFILTLIPYILMLIFGQMPRETIWHNLYYSSFLPILLISASWSGQLLAIPLLTQAGSLIAKLDSLTQKTKRWMLFLLIPISFLFYLSSMPNRYIISVNYSGPVYDQAFFYGHIPFWIMFLIFIVWILIYSFGKTEIRQQGFIADNILIKWPDVVSTYWYELDDQARISIKYKRILWTKPASIVLLVPSEKQQIVRDILLANNIKEE